MKKEVKVNLVCSKSCCKCYVCGRFFVGKDPSRTLKKHLLSHVKYSLCAICGKSVVALSSHERLNHFPEVYVDSEQTTARLSPKKRKDTLKETPKLTHKIVSHRKRKKIRKWQCSTCGKMFQSSVQLKDHNFTHTNEKPYQCQICGKSFNTQYICNKHKMWVHSKQPLYHCDLCGNGYKSVPSLYVHVKKHSGERPYKCLECDKSFLTKPHLNNHLYVHGKERPFKCTVCNKGYKSNYELQKHIVSHSKKDKKKTIGPTH